MGALRRLYRGENHYDFTRAWKWGVRISAVLFIVSLVSLATRGLNLGIDFTGGVSWQVKAPGATVEQTRDALRPLGLSEAKVQVIGTNTVRVQASADSQAQQNSVRDALAEMAGVPAGDVAVSTVGPTWGGVVTQSAVRALIVFLLGILAYVTLTFRGEWKMAIGVIVAVIHDIVISVGVYSIFQFEVTPATVIAFLTILGYSIYDTVVVYDKVVENQARVGLSSRLTYTDMMSVSLNQVLLRSINTSVVAVLPVLSTLFIGALLLGAVTLEEFSIALTVGLTIGAYSSLFVAAPVVAWLKEREPRYRALRERLETTRGAAGDDATVAGEGDADGSTPAAAVTGTPRGAGTAPGANAPAAGSSYVSGAIPPRPRKKTKRR